MGEVNILKIDGIVRLIQIIDGKVMSMLLEKCYLKFDPEVKRFGIWPDDWVIGFDCNHLGYGTKENTEDFVVSEIQSIVDQLIDKDKDLRGLVDDISNGVIV